MALRNMMQLQQPLHTEGNDELMIFGTGSVAQAVVVALASADIAASRVHIVSRNSARVRELSALGNSIAGAARTPSRFYAVNLRGDVVGEQLVETIGSVRPRALFILASRHRPRDAWGVRSAWTSFLEAAGFGVTFALHADLGLKIARAAVETCPSTLIINACYPDAVNVVLAGHVANVIMGVGNIMTIEASVRSGIDIAMDADLKLAGGYAGLQSDRSPARLWVNDEEVDVTRLHLAHRDVSPENQRSIIASSSLSVLRAITRTESVQIAMPGPMGMVGGYPVAIDRTGIRLRLPEGTSVDRLVAFNMESLKADGIASVDSTRVVFANEAAHALSLMPETRDIAEGYEVSDLEAAADALSELRNRLT
jgi:hypothetical protein